MSGEDWVKRFKSLKKPTAAGHRAWENAMRREGGGMMMNQTGPGRQVWVGSALIVGIGIGIGIGK